MSLSRLLFAPLIPVLDRYGFRHKFLVVALVMLTQLVCMSLVIAQRFHEDTRYEHPVSQYAQPVAAGLQLDNKVLPQLGGLIAGRTKAQQELLITAFFMLLFTMILFFLVLNSLYHSIRDQIHGISTAANNLMEGDLNRQMAVQSGDEFHDIGRQLSHVVTELGNSVFSIRQSCQGLEQLGVETYDATQEVRRQVETQAEEISQAATAMHEMAASVEEVSRSTVAAAEDAGKASDAAQTGQQIVNNVVDTIHSLTAEVQRAEGAISQLARDSGAITRIVETIHGIADQTNLLALNAAIEAARAGEHGRGFAVVADEVRTLANHTQNATTEIQQMIQRLQEGSHLSANIMRTSADQAGACELQAAEARGALEDIVAHVSRINAANLQIAAAAEEQSAVAEEINRNLTNISNSSENTAQTSQKAFESAAKIATLGGEIMALVERFDLDDAVARERLARQEKLLEWNSELDVGVAELNRQHQRLIDIANELYRLSRQGNNEYAMRRVMDSLINYTATHFRYEEMLMERYGYPDLAAHQEKHARLVEKVMGFKHRIDRGELLVDELMDFIREWLNRHIRHTDQEYTAHLNQQGVR